MHILLLTIFAHRKIIYLSVCKLLHGSMSSNNISPYLTPVPFFLAFVVVHISVNGATFLCYTKYVRKTVEACGRYESIKQHSDGFSRDLWCRNLTSVHTRPGAIPTPESESSFDSDSESTQSFDAIMLPNGDGPHCTSAN